ncbi:MAG: hypothetical protein ACKVPX_01215 [Myxococcaceae bacterium]
MRYASDDGSFTSDGLLITDYEGACKGLREGKYFQSSKSVTVRLRERSEFEGYPYWGIAPPVEGSYPLLTDVEPPPSQTHLGLGQFVSVGPACNPRLELPSSGELTVEKLTGTGAGQRVMGHLRMVLPEDGTIDVDFEVDTCDLTPGVPFVQSCADRP